MLAVLFTLCTVGYLAALGVAVASLVTRRISTVALLLSPLAGIGVALSLTLTLNRAGLGVGAFAQPLVALLGLFAIAMFVWRRPVVPWVEVRWCAPAMAAGLLLSGGALFRYGFSWASNANHDMVVYAGSAQDLLRHGFFAIPSLRDLIAGTDAGQNMWFLEILPPNRYGADVLLALAAGTIHVDTIGVYMPLCCVAFVTLIAATAALVADPTRPRWMMPAAALAMSIANPLSLYSVYQQLLPQIFGIAAIAGIVALASQDSADRWREGQGALVLGAVATGLFFVYPELSPILIPGAVLALPFVVWRSRTNLRAAVSHAAARCGIATVVVLVLFNVQLFTLAATFRVLFGVAAKTVNGEQVIIDYLVPSGLANFWGFMPFSNYPEPALSFAIIAGAMALVAVTLAAVRSLPRGRYADAMLVALVGLCSYLLAKQSAYVLFKLAFVIQPFLVPFELLGLAAIVRWMVGLTRMPEGPIRNVVSTAALATTFYSTFVYASSSADANVHKSAQFTEINAASAGDLYGALRRIAAASAATTEFRTDAFLLQLATFEGLELAGHPLAYLALDPHGKLFINPESLSESIRRGPIFGWPQNDRTDAEAINNARIAAFGYRLMSVGSTHLAAYVPPPLPRGMRSDGDPMLLQTGPDLSILNRAQFDHSFGVRAIPVSRVHDFLLIVDSSLGSEFGPAFRLNGAENVETGLGKEPLGYIEPDPFDSRRYVTSLGKMMLLEVIGAAPSVRMRFDLTATLNPASDDAVLPAITISGATTVHIPAPGNGSARIISPPVRPLEKDGHRYLILRFDHHFVRHEVYRSWLMRLYGGDVELARREFTAYARNISIENGSAPEPTAVRLAQLPGALITGALQYAGFYEDGWMSRHAHVALHASRASDVLHVRLMVPPGRPPESVVISEDGRVIRRLESVPASYADMTFPNNPIGEHTIAVDAFGTARLSKADPRAAWARVDVIAFERPGSVVEIAGTGTELLDESAWFPLETYDGRTFRWMQSGARLSVLPTSTRRTLMMDVAAGPSSGGTVPLEVRIGGRTVRILVTGEQNVRIPVPVSRTAQVVELRAPLGTIKVPGDLRNLELRVFKAAVE